MAINMMCMNSKCKFYWEDNCTRNLNEERIEIDENGKCETFEEGLSDFYKELILDTEPRFSIEEDSICYGCQHYTGEDDCNIQVVCVEGSMNSYGTEGISYEKIQKYIKDCGYTYSVETVLEEYQNKYTKGYYVSHTMKDCIINLEKEIKNIISQSE